ncbi:MAG: hypothetical protein HGB22_11325 [Chlorobiaceae bacterium]|nr:hypothetical protein [Chlorobiaceae bacterium]
MLVKLAKYLSLITIAALTAILLVVVFTNGQVIGRSAGFGWLVELMYVALISSSLLIGYVHWQKKQKVWAALFWANFFIVLIPTILSAGGLIKVPSALLVFLDLYWISQYVVYAVSRSGLNIFRER